MELNPDFAEGKNSWNHSNHVVFVQTAPGIGAEQAEAALRPFKSKYYAGDEKDLKENGYRPDRHGDRLTLQLIPFSDLHFDESLNMGRSVSKTYLFTLILIALVVLVIACFNFINLNVARAFTRARKWASARRLAPARGRSFCSYGRKVFFCVSWLYSLG